MSNSQLINIVKAANNIVKTLLETKSKEEMMIIVYRTCYAKKIRVMSLCLRDTEEIIYHATAVDYNEVKRIGEKLASIMRKGKRVRVTSDLGTDLTASIEGKFCEVHVGFAVKPGPPIGCLPDGETA